MPGTSLRARALRHLTRREHSRAELERKLWPHALAAAADAASHDEPAAEAARRALGAALDDLTARGLLSDERAAESVLALAGRRFGSRRLKHTLQAKGLAPELVSAALQQSRTTELERAREIWRRRFGAAAADPAERARQARFLSGRGFDAEVVRRVVKGLDEE